MNQEKGAHRIHGTGRFTYKFLVDFYGKIEGKIQSSHGIYVDTGFCVFNLPLLLGELFKLMK